jgi:hypothetical protein
VKKNTSTPKRRQKTLQTQKATAPTISLARAKNRHTYLKEKKKQQ